MGSAPAETSFGGHATRPRDGDVVISKLSARVEHQVSIAPTQLAFVCRTEASAIADGVQLARERQVDAWLTRDHRHYVKIESHRIDPR